MVYLAADIHGYIEVKKVTRFFEEEIKKTKLSENDYLIILGDVGLCWDNGESDNYVRKMLESLPVTVLWVDGNHENFDIIDALPVTDWHGGKAQFIGDKIIHLMRGYVYEIFGKKFFAFGGAYSTDKMIREEHISWWEREMPSQEEYERGLANLQKEGYRVDYIITHTVNSKTATLFPDNEFAKGEKELQDYFQKIADTVEFENWFFGHWHVDCDIDKFIGIYYDIIKLAEREEEQKKSEIRKVQIGDEKILANIHITSWRTAFDKILSDEILEKMTDIKKTEEMYKYLLENNIGNGTVLSIDSKPHCIAFWDKSREKDMQGYAELICIHSLKENWGKGYGSMIMDYVLKEIKNAGFTKVMLWVFEENTRARKFYEKYGFTISQKTKTSFNAVEVMYIKDLSLE